MKCKEEISVQSNINQTMEESQFIVTAKVNEVPIEGHSRIQLRPNGTHMYVHTMCDDKELQVDKIEDIVFNDDNALIQLKNLLTVEFDDHSASAYANCKSEIQKLIKSRKIVLRYSSGNLKTRGMMCDDKLDGKVGHFYDQAGEPKKAVLEMEEGMLDGTCVFYNFYNEFVFKATYAYNKPTKDGFLTTPQGVEHIQKSLFADLDPLGDDFVEQICEAADIPHFPELTFDTGDKSTAHGAEAILEVQRSVTQIIEKAKLDAQALATKIHADAILAAESIRAAAKQEADLESERIRANAIVTAEDKTTDALEEAKRILADAESKADMILAKIKRDAEYEAEASVDQINRIARVDANQVIERAKVEAESQSKQIRIAAEIKAHHTINDAIAYRDTQVRPILAWIEKTRGKLEQDLDDLSRFQKELEKDTVTHTHPYFWFLFFSGLILGAGYVFLNKGV